MRSLVLSLFMLASPVLLADALTENPALVRQYSLDTTAIMRHAMKRLISEGPGNSLDVPMTGEGIAEAVAQSIKYLRQKQPDRFATTVQEATLLAAGKDVITEQQLTDAIQARRVYQTPLPFPPALDCYEAMRKAPGLNPNQRLLAYRLAQYALFQAKERDRTEDSLKGKN